MLTFFCELAEPELSRVLSSAVIEELANAQAAVSMAMLDLSAERAALIRQLNAHGVPVTAWLLLAEEHGYWLTADNAVRARARYLEVRRWVAAQGLSVICYGLDIETPVADSADLFREGRAALWRLLARRRSRADLRVAQRVYDELLDQIRRDGFAVESYQFPLIVDERRARSTLLQRALGVVDIKTDREVLMLYRSLLPAPLAGLLVDAFGSDADAIAVGITGGGVDFVLESTRLLTVSELLADLRSAARYTRNLYVFSLEGCVHRGQLTELLGAELSPGPPPGAGLLLAQGLRMVLRTALAAEARLARWRRIDSSYS